MAIVPPLPDTERRVSYTPTASTGPFDIPFSIWASGTDYENWLEVWLNGVKLTPVVQWTLALETGSVATTARPLTNAQVTLVSAATGTLEIIGADRPDRTTQFTEGVGVPAHDQNIALSRLAAIDREAWDFRPRTVHVPGGEALNALPNASHRAEGGAIGFVPGSPNTPIILPFSDATLVYGLVVESIAALRLLTGNTVATGTGAYVVSYTAGENRGGGWFWYDSSDESSADDGFLVIVDAASRRWKRPSDTILNGFQAGLRGDNELPHEAALMQDIFDASAARMMAIRLQVGTYYVGDPDYTSTQQFAIELGDGGQGPIIVGDGWNTWLRRSPGYGNADAPKTGAKAGQAGQEGGGPAYILGHTPEENDPVNDMRLEGFRVGPDSFDENEVGGHTFNIKCRRSTFRDVALYKAKGIGWIVRAEQTEWIGCNSYEVDTVYGGAAYRLGWGQDTIFRDASHVESADDCIQININEGTVGAFDDPTDKIARRNIWSNVNCYAGQGACYAVLAGSRNSNVKSTHSGIVQTTNGSNKIRIKDGNADLSVGLQVLCANFTGGNGLAAGDINGTRTVSDVFAGNDYELEVGANATSTGSITAQGDTQSVMIQTFNGEPRVRLRIPNHEAVVGSTSIQVRDWVTVAGIASSDVDGTRAVTAIIDEHNLEIEADANASSSTGPSFADVTTSFAILFDGGIQDHHIENVGGTGGDSAPTGFGGVARKFHNTEATEPMTVFVHNSVIKSTDTVSSVHTRVNGFAAPAIIRLTNDRIVTPRGVALGMEAVFVRNGSAPFGIHADTLWDVDQFEYDAPSLDETPTIICDGGKLLMRNGIIHMRDDFNGVICADEYEINYPYKQVTRTAIAAIVANWVIEELLFENVIFEGIGDGFVALQLGNIKRGLVKNCQFVPADGATTWKIASMRAAQDGAIGTTNIVFDGCNFGGKDPQNRFTGWVDGVGNDVRGDKATYTVTATADGTGTGHINDFARHVVVSSSGATQQCALPSGTNENVGKQITIWVGANGFELITPDTSGATINNVDSDGTNQADIAANTLSRVTLVAANTWLLENLTNLGAVNTAIVPDND